MASKNAKANKQLAVLLPILDDVKLVSRGFENKRGEARAYTMVTLANGKTYFIRRVMDEGVLRWSLDKEVESDREERNESVKSSLEELDDEPKKKKKSKKVVVEDDEDEDEDDEDEE